MTDAPKDRSFETPFAVRLRAARKMAGLSMEELAAKLGGRVTKQAISKYERGRMMPSPDVMERLVEVLGAATWGASPLKAADAELAPPLLLREETDGRAAACGERPMFRRQRLVGKLLNRSSARTDEVAPAIADANANPQAEPEPPATRRLTEASVELRSAMHFLIRTDFPSLADRRARYIRAWEAGAGPERIRFREGEKLAAKSASALKYRLADHLQRYLELEKLLGLPAPFENPVEGMAVTNETEVEAAARKVRRSWDLGSGPIVNLLGLLEDRGVRVYETRGIEGFEGLSGVFGGEPPLPFVAVSRDVPPDRVRFTAAHELAHILCGLPEKEDAEGLCQKFAGAFLLPREAVERVFGGGPRRKVALAELAEIKTTYGISLQAIMWRAKSLGLVGERQFRSFRETVNARRWAVTEPVEFAGVERASRFRRLIHGAVAAGILDLERAAELAGVPAEQLKDEIGEIF
jgi:Zn-dependent peptidase ImmA (M78 family)/transcriptional regulator with XRE-family HTH domain